MAYVRPGSFHLTVGERERLRAARRAAKVTQTDLAEKLGIGCGTNIMFIETGKRRVVLEEVELMAKICGLESARDILEEVDLEERSAVTLPPPAPPAAQGSYMSVPTSGVFLSRTLDAPRLSPNHITETMMRLIGIVNDFSVHELEEVIESAKIVREVRDELRAEAEGR